MNGPSSEWSRTYIDINLGTNNPPHMGVERTEQRGAGLAQGAAAGKASHTEIFWAGSSQLNGYE